MIHEIPTMLHFTAKLGLCQIVNRLLDLPCATDVLSLRNSEGHTPADLARHRGHNELAEFLEEYSKTVSQFHIKQSLNNPGFSLSFGGPCGPCCKANQ